MRCRCRCGLAVTRRYLGDISAASRRHLGGISAASRRHRGGISANISAQERTEKKYKEVSSADTAHPKVLDVPVWPRSHRDRVEIACTTTVHNNSCRRRRICRGATTSRSSARRGSVSTSRPSEPRRIPANCGPRYSPTCRASSRTAIRRGRSYLGIYSQYPAPGPFRERRETLPARSAACASCSEHLIRTISELEMRVWVTADATQQDGMLAAVRGQ